MSSNLHINAGCAFVSFHDKIHLSATLKRSDYELVSETKKSPSWDVSPWTGENLLNLIWLNLIMYFRLSS